MGRKLKEKTKEYKTIRVLEDTYKELVKIKSLLQIKMEKMISMDDVIKFLISQLPEIHIESRIVERRQENATAYNSGRTDKDYQREV